MFKLFYLLIALNMQFPLSNGNYGFTTGLKNDTSQFLFIRERKDNVLYRGLDFKDTLLTVKIGGLEGEVKWEYFFKGMDSIHYAQISPCMKKGNFKIGYSMLKDKIILEDKFLAFLKYKKGRFSAFAQGDFMGYNVYGFDYEHNLSGDTLMKIEWKNANKRETGTLRIEAKFGR